MSHLPRHKTPGRTSGTQAALDSQFRLPIKTSALDDTAAEFVLVNSQCCCVSVATALWLNAPTRGSARGFRSVSASSQAPDQFSQLLRCQQKFSIEVVRIRPVKTHFGAQKDQKLRRTESLLSAAIWPLTLLAIVNQSRALCRDSHQSEVTWAKKLQYLLSLHHHSLWGRWLWLCLWLSILPCKQLHIALAIKTNNLTKLHMIKH